MWAKTFRLEPNKKFQAKNRRTLFDPWPFCRCINRAVRSMLLWSLHSILWQPQGRIRSSEQNFHLQSVFYMPIFFSYFSFLYREVEHAVLNPVMCILTTLEVEHAALNLSPVLYIDNPRCWTCCSEHFHQFHGNPRSWRFYWTLLPFPWQP